MTALPNPVREALDERVDEAAVQRIWRGVHRVRSEKAGRLRGHDWLAFAALAAATAFAVFIWTRDPHPDPGPLHLRSGGEVAVLSVAPSEDPAVTTLSDGSTITLARGATLRTLENSGSVFMAHLLAGRADFVVRPHGPRRWSIECGLGRVEVTGTRFTIDRRPAAVRVSVDEGTVLVRGPDVPDGIQHLVQGQSIELVAPAPPPSAPPPAAAPPGSAAAPSAPPPLPAAPPAPAPSDAPWRRLAREQAYGEAYRALGPGGVASELSEATVEDLMTLADVARLSGHPAEAVDPLTRVASGHGDGRASLAAFTLGRLYLDNLGNPAAAAAWFGRAVALPLPAGLREPAYARLVEAYARAGDAASARAALDRYKQLFPDAPSLPSLRRWVPSE